MIHHHLPPGIPIPSLLPPHAEIATPAQRRLDTITKIPKSLQTAACALSHGHAKDHTLARLDDATRTLAVLVIATLGGLGLHQPGARIPLWLGAMSWLTAMPAVQMGLNAIFKAKVGFDLNQKYVSSNGEVRRLFLDPNYMPQQVLPLAQQLALADRYSIPPERSDRLSLLHARLKRITVQAHTWWMLMAGLATPVLSAVICDLLENPLKNRISQHRLRQLPRQLQASALAGLDNTQVRRIAEKSIQNVIGSGTDISTLSRWWKQLPEALLDAMDLQRLHQRNFLRLSSEQRLDRLAEHIARSLKSVNIAAKFATVLEDQQERLNDILEPVESALWRQSKVTRALSETNRLTGLRHDTTLLRNTAEGTLGHFKQLLELAKGSQAEQRIRKKLDRSTLSDIEHLVLRKGSLSKAVQYAGGESAFNRVMRSFLQQRFGPAFAQTGAYPKAFLLNALESRALRAKWWRNYPLKIGGSVLILTLLFTTFVLGREVAPSQDSKGPSS